MGGRGPSYVVLLLCLVPGCSETLVDLPAREAQSANGAATARAGERPKLTDLEGHELALDDPAFKAIALVFILSDCPICNAYIPELNRLHESFAGRGIRSVLVHADADTTPHEASQHAHEYRIQLPVALDRHHEWVKKAGASIAPEAAVFSPAGELLYRGRIDNQYAGLGKRRAVVTSHDLRDALEAIVADRPIKVPRTEAIGCVIPEDSSRD